MKLEKWIDQGLNKTGKRAADLARLLKITPDKVSKMRKGKRQPKADEIGLIEEFLGEPAPVPRGRPPDDPEAANGPTSRVVGYVGAGTAAHFYAVSQGDLEEIPAPEGSNRNTVAVEVRGTSLGALFDHWLVFYDDVRRPVTTDLVGKLCVVGLDDDRVLVKKIRRGRRVGSFDLISNTGEPAIEDARIEWAARVKIMTPR